MSLLLSLLGIMGWAIWGYTVAFLDPEAPLATLAFYGGLFVALTCTLARLLETPAYEDADGVRVGARPGLGHGWVLATLLLFAMWLQSLRMLTQLNGILLFATLFFIELGFRLTGGGHRSQPKRRLRRVAVPNTASGREP